MPPVISNSFSSFERKPDIELVGVQVEATNKVYCIDHIPDGVDPANEEQCTPFLADDTWLDEVSPCEVCGTHLAFIEL